MSDTTVRPAPNARAVPDQARAAAPAAEAFWRPAGPVLLGSDGTGNTDAPVRAARAAAAALGVPVRVVAVLDAPPAYAYGPQLLPVAVEVGEARRRALRAAVQRTLESAGSSEGPAGAAEPANWPVDVIDGERRQGLADEAAAHNAGLVVVGEGRHRLIDRVLTGELALGVLRRVRCPVLSVAAGFDGVPRTAVAGVDFSPASVRAAQVALRLLAPGGRLVLVHAPLHVPVLPAAEVDDAARALIESWARQEAAGAGAQLERVRALLARDNPAGVTIDVLAVEGAPASALLRTADAAGADLVAVGTHGGGWLDRLLVGSVAERVVRHAGRSVVTVPPPAGAAGVALDLWAGGRAEEAHPEAWAAVLDAFTRRNRGRRTRLVVVGADGATFAEQDGLTLTGTVYDRHDRAVEFLFTDPAGGAGARRFTHYAPAPERLVVRADAAGRDAALEVVQARGSTALTFLAAPAPAVAPAAGAARPGAAPGAEARPPVPTLEATERVRAELRDRVPRGEAGALVAVTPAPVRSCYLVLEHVTGPRAAVLDYTAFLLSPEGEPPDGAHTRPEFVAVEFDDGERLSLVLSRALYDGGVPG